MPAVPHAVNAGAAAMMAVLDIEATINMGRDVDGAICDGCTVANEAQLRSSLTAAREALSCAASALFTGELERRRLERIVTETAAANAGCVDQPTVSLRIGDSTFAMTTSGEVLETVDYLPNGQPDWNTAGICDHRGVAGESGYDHLFEALNEAHINATLVYGNAKRLDG